VQRADRAKKRSEKRRKAEQEQLIFSEVMSTVSNEMVNETVGEIICEICSDIFEWLEIKKAAIDMMIDRMINEECLLSVKDIAMSEVRSAMVSYADGHCKRVDEVDKLKKRIKEVP